MAALTTRQWSRSLALTPEDSACRLATALPRDTRDAALSISLASLRECAETRPGRSFSTFNTTAATSRPELTASTCEELQAADPRLEEASTMLVLLHTTAPA